MKTFLQEGLKKLKIDLSENMIESLLFYVKFLLKYNEHTNLTAIREERDVIEKHILDSLLLEEFIPKDTKIAIDIGTGAGFPGMVLAIIHPEIEFTLLDSVGKKTIFLNKLVEELSLKNVEVIHGRAEEFLQQGKRESYDVGFCRGVSQLAVILEYVIPFLKKGGVFLPQKMVGTEEVETAKHAFEELASVLEKEYIRYLPHYEEKRLILQIRKQEKTNLKYPRKVGLATKKPL